MHRNNPNNIRQKIFKLITSLKEQAEAMATQTQQQISSLEHQVKTTNTSRTDLDNLTSTLPCDLQSRRKRFEDEYKELESLLEQAKNPNTSEKERLPLEVIEKIIKIANTYKDSFLNLAYMDSFVVQIGSNISRRA